MLIEHAKSKGDGQRYEEHNEVVLAAPDYVDHLPSSLEAVFMLPQTADTGNTYEAQARSAHRAFLSEYRLDASRVPLVQFERHRDPPFSCVDCGASPAATP